MVRKENHSRLIVKILSSCTVLSIFSVCISFMLSSSAVIAYAADGALDVTGRIYEFDEKSHYEFSNAEESKGIKTYGNFTIAGNIADTSDRDGIPAYGVSNGNISLSYTYGDSLLNTKDENWHLTGDKSKRIDSIKLDKNVLKGAIVLQTSKDGEKWIKDVSYTDVFKKTPVQTEAFYTTNDMQQTNGTYYRVIVVYQIGRKTGSNHISFIPLPGDTYEYKEYAEVYEFYIYNTQNLNLEGGNTLRYNVGQLVNTGKDNGYSGSSEINAKDPHYNWELGNFFVSGYTRQTDASDGTPIFLKNVGDHVSLWFNLEQDIDMLHGNEALSIAEDVDGYDQYFQTKKTNFGRGTLIIRSTNSENVTDEPKIYTNYLEANTSIGADTKVQLFEEGDYEVALDYKIKNDKTKIFGRSVLPVYTDYRISFKFSIRNGNCMVYPFDIKTGSELTNTSITPNGFYLDLARSKYLDVNVKKEVMNEGADGLTEDVRFNKPAKDGDKYTDEGIYTISVSNRYTEQTTTKKIYVGSNKAMMAYITTGLPFRDINTQIANGATISDDGTIIPPEIGKTTSKVTTEQSATESSVALPYVDSHQRNGIIIALGTVIVVVVVGAFAVVKKKKQKVATENDKEDQDK